MFRALLFGKFYILLQKNPLQFQPFRGILKDRCGLFSAAFSVQIAVFHFDKEMLFSVNKKCHWLLAAHLMGDGSWRLHGLALKLGSIMPDVLLYTYVSGHKYDTTAEKVAGNLAELKRAGSWTVRDCFRLGYNLHFLEDYFTYPHNSHFEGGFIAHCLYEHRLSRALQRYLHENPRPAATVLPPPDAVCAVLEEHHSAYMRTAPSPENDAAYIVSCTELVGWEVFAAFSRQAASARALAFLQRVGIA